MKIVSKGRALHSQAYYEKKKKKKRIKLLLLSILVFLALALVVLVMRHEKFQVSEVLLIGADVTDEVDIRQAAQRLMAGSYFWVIPKSNTLVYPKDDILSGLAEEFPRFESIDVGLEGINTLVVEVKERLPFALYCHKFININDTSGCYFLDREGFIFAPAPSFSEGVYFIYTTEDALENPLGQRLIPSDEFKSLPLFLKDLSLIGIYPVMLKIGENEFSLYLPNGAEIAWNRSDDLRLVRANLEAFLNSEPIKKDSDFLDKLESLDLRTENKVFYKFR